MAHETDRGLKRPQATLKQVAERAGVSKMTASRALNSPHLVRQVTRDRVRAAIDELNYRPNLAARQLALGQSLFIGLTYNNPSSSYLNELMIGALKASRRSGHHLVVDEIDDADAADARDVARRIRDTGLDGVIIVPPLSESEELAAALLSLKIPFVRLTAARSGAATPSPTVAIDDAAAAAAMTQRLIALGHRRIAFIGGPGDNGQAKARTRGYRTALTAAEIPVVPALIREGAYNFNSGMEATRTLLSLEEKPTAIFAANDDMAAGAIAQCYEHRLRVPADVSVVGFDDTMMATSVWPPLATVRQPIADMAAKAVEMVVAQVSGTLTEAKVMMGVEIVERGSLAPVHWRAP